MRAHWRVLLGTATAAGTAAVLGIGQPLMTAWTGVVTWEGATYCGSTDRGEEWWYLDAWFVWWLTSAMVLGVVAGLKVAGFGLERTTGLRGGGRIAGHAAVVLAIAVAATAAAFAALWRTLLYLFGLLEEACIDISTVHEVVVPGLVLGAIAIAVAALLPETGYAFTAGWVWIWVVHVGAWIVGWQSGRSGFGFVGVPRVPHDAVGLVQGLVKTFYIGGYLVVLPLFVFLRAQRRVWSSGRAGLSMLVVHFLVVAAGYIAQAERFG